MMQQRLNGRSRRRGAPLLGVAALALLAPTACGGGSEGEPDAGGSGDAQGDALAGDAGGDGAGAGWSAPTPTNDWRVLFNYRGRIPNDNEGENELWLMDAMGEARYAVTDFGKLKEGDEELSCEFGCVVSPNLEWIAVATGPPDQDGFDFKIGRFNDQLEVQILKGAVWEDIVDFQFAGDTLYYSKCTDLCSGPSSRYTLYEVPLPNVNDRRSIIQGFPPDTEDSTYKGHFHAGPNGENIVLLATTIRSVEVFLWRKGLGRVPLDFICVNGSEDNCQGSGTPYTDTDPVAISPDGRWIVFFTFSGRYQRARLYDAENPDASVTPTRIAGVGEGKSYLQNACDPGELEDWQWRSVLGDPKFTPDGSDIVFLTGTACQIRDPERCPNGNAPCQPKKPRRNLRRIRLETLRQGQDLAPSDVLNLTENPFGDVVEHQQVTEFDISPDGATAVFTATPRLGQNGGPLADEDSRHRNDREVYRIRLDGQGMQQLTNELTWEAQSPRIVPLEPELPDSVRQDRGGE